jgi:glycosyltransferase involved in cell wall biosynthesis
LLYAKFAYAPDSQGLLEPIGASDLLPQTEGSRSSRLDLLSEASGLTGFRKRGREVPELKLSIIMAAFNEQETIEQAISEILEIDYPCAMELIVIDDGSKDDTPNLLAEINDPRITVFRHEKNLGKGAAILTGVRFASGTHILPFDADLEYTPEDIPKILEPVLRGRCSVVFGVRLFGYNTVYRSYIYALGNRMLTRITNIMFGACLSDLHTCLKLIPTSLIQSMRLSEAGFGLDTEISASLLRCGVRPFEVPVSYFSRSHEEGKKITWRDAFACLWILIRVRTLPRSRLLRTDDLSKRGSSDRVADLEPGAPKNLSGRALTMVETDATMSIGLARAD